MAVIITIIILLTLLLKLLIFTNLLWMFKFKHATVIVFFCNSFWVAGDNFHISFKISFKQLINSTVIIVIVTNTKQCLNVIPHCTTKCTCIHINFIPQSAKVDYCWKTKQTFLWLLYQLSVIATCLEYKLQIDYDRLKNAEFKVLNQPMRDKHE